MGPAVVVQAPPKALPAWAPADFVCGDEPGKPDQKTTKGKVEAYVADLIGWGRTCSTKLNARGDDARRYDLVAK